MLDRFSFRDDHADFYTPPVVLHGMLAIQQLASVKAVPFGGYSQAERQRIIMGQPELVEALELDPSQVSSEHAATSCPAAFAYRQKDPALLQTGISKGVPFCQDPWLHWSSPVGVMLESYHIAAPGVSCRRIVLLHWP